MAGDSVRPAAAPRQTGLGVVGLLLALGPLILFGVAAAANIGGPLTSVLVFAIPVLATTVGVVLVVIRLIRRRAITWAYSIAAVAIFVGGVGYVLWFYLTLVAVQFGNGPL